MRPRFAARVHHWVGTVLSWWGWHSLAVQAWGDAVRADASWPQAHLSLAEGLARRGLWAQASEAYAQAARLRPADGTIYAGLVMSLCRCRRTRAALAALERLLAIETGRGELHVLKGALLLRAARPVEAIRAFRWASSLGLPANAPRFVLGEAVLGERGWHQVLSAFQQAASAAEGRSATAGFGYSVLNRPPAGVSALPRPLPRRLPWLPVLARGVRTLLGGEWRRQREWLAFAGLVRIRPVRANWLRNLAGAVVMMAIAIPAAAQNAHGGRPAVRACVEARGEVAVAACRLALALRPTGAAADTVHRVLALELVALKRWAEAVEVYRAWARLRPDEAAVRLRLGSALLHGLDRPSEAAAVFQEAIVLQPAEAEAHAGLAVALNVLGRHPEAVQAFAEAERREPAFFEHRPGAQAVRDAARKGERWP